MPNPTNRPLTDLVQQPRANFQNAKPFPHFVIDNFLAPELAQKLVNEFPPFETAHALAENGQAGGKSTRPNMRELGNPFRELDAFFASSQFLHWMSHVTGIPDLLYDPDHFGGGTHENLNGQDMSVHIDFNYHPTQGWHRRLNALIYLNPEWKEEWGGQLELWQNPWDGPSKNCIAKISPVFNRLVVFPTTEQSWHGFESVKIPFDRLPFVKSRRSIAIYLYSKERPAAETGAMHTTVYYERPLPESILPDKTISRADWEEMRRLTARRDDLLKIIYAREGKLNSLVESLNKKVLQLESEISMLRPGSPAESVEAQKSLWQQKEIVSGEAMASRESLQGLLKLVQEPGAEIPTSPLLFAPSSNDEHRAVSGFWRLKQLSAGVTVRILANFKLRPRIWALIRLRDSEKLQLVFLAREFQSFFLAHQAASPGSLVVPRGAIYGQVVEVRNQLGEKLFLPDELKTRTHALVLAWLFFTTHIAKNILLGRIHGRWIWRLSVAYRRVLKAMGIHVPVLPPPQRR